MAIDRELVLQLAAQRAGFTESQLDALRRRDWTTLLAERMAPAATDDVASGLAPDLLAEDPVAQPPQQDLRADLERVSARLAVIRQQRDAALHVLRQLAARLGCCPQCWGTDPSCSACAGNGTPGHFPPDPQLREWLAPALARAPGHGPADGSTRGDPTSTDDAAGAGAPWPPVPDPTGAAPVDPLTPTDPARPRTDGWA